MSLSSISPLDGRYLDWVSPLSHVFSEYELIRLRLHIEIEWLIELANVVRINSMRHITETECETLRNIKLNFRESDAAHVKDIERSTKHDVKAVEYYLRERLSETTLADLCPWIHFCCTSEDINNLSYALALKRSIQTIWIPAAHGLVQAVASWARETREIPMLSRTHGQPASPTTIGKELAVFVSRWQHQLHQMHGQEYVGKFNGAVGNFNAHTIAFPEVDWEDVAQVFVERLGLTYNPLTTQIEPHDHICECLHRIIRFNNITLDFVRDLWMYISLGYFCQRVTAGEVGSSTMPHKVNPIKFENAEANLGIGNSILDHLANKLPVSRLQRDLSDSSALRNLGAGIAYSYLAIGSTSDGITELSLETSVMQQDLDSSWQILSEAAQTLLRKAGHVDAYEVLTNLTRGKEITRDVMLEIIEGLDIPDADKERLRTTRPDTYTGLAAHLVRHIE